MLATRRQMLAGAILTTTLAPIVARAFPDRPITLVVSSAAGASLDALARILSPPVSERLGVSVAVLNEGGSAGMLAFRRVARSAPDGHTLLVTGDALVLAELIQPQAGFTVRDNFAPVIQAIRSPQILVTHPDAPFRDIAGYVNAARARPGRLNVGLSSWGGIAHIVHEMLSQQLGGLHVEYITYRGGGPATLDLLSRNTDMLIITLPAVIELVRRKELVPLAVTSGARDPALPEVPTLSETLAPGFDVDAWQGVFAPAGTPQPIVAELYRVFAKAMDDPAVRPTLETLGYQIVAAPPEAFAERTRTANTLFARVVEAAGLRQREP